MKTLFLLLWFVPGVALADVSVPRAKQYLWTVFDVAASGGESVPHSMGVKLPAGAFITNAWVYINTKFAASGTESLGVSCVGSQDIVAYQPVKNLAVNDVFGGQPVSALSDTATPSIVGPIAYQSAMEMVGFGSVPESCDMVVNVRGDSGYTPYTSGKATVIVEYFRQ